MQPHTVISLCTLVLLLILYIYVHYRLYRLSKRVYKLETKPTTLPKLTLNECSQGVCPLPATSPSLPPPPPTEDELEAELEEELTELTEEEKTDL